MRRPRILLAPGPWLGHAVPLLEVASTLARQGHEVYLAADVGKFLPPGVKTFAPALPVYRQAASLGALESRMTARQALTFFSIFMDWTATQLSGFIRARQVDVAVIDQMNLGGGVAAESSGVPWASMAMMPALRDGKTLNRLRAPLNRLRRKWGLPPAPAKGSEIGLSPWRHFCPWIPRFDLWPSPPQTLHVGAPYPTSAKPPPDVARWLSAGDPRQDCVLVTLGSAPSPEARRAAARFLAALLPVLRRLKVRALMGATADHPPRSSAELHVAPFLDYGSVLGRVRAVVTHGGWGVVSRAMACGVPMLVVPFERDPFFNAALVDRIGAGRQLNALRPVAPSKLEDALEQVLQLRGPMRAVAEALQVEFAECGGITAFASAIAKLARQRASSASSR